MPSYRGKRLIDVALVCVTAPVSLPVLFVLACVVRASTGSPVLFTQERIGEGERIFRIVKFRTMRDVRAADGTLLPDEHRLTAVGRRLRGWSLDELPELWNVLRGEMSMVGPRPLLPRYLPRYSPRHRRRHEVAPGLTGLAQVMGRNALTWQDKFELDIQYVERCSPRMDLWILFRTARAVLLREGISAAGEATMPEFVGYDAAGRRDRPDEAKPR